MTDSAANSVLLEREAERFSRDVGIPPCPEILEKFSSAMRAAEPNLRLLAALIANDAGLSAAMLSIVNSPFYGLERKAASVQQALSILGLRAGANIVTGLLLKFAFPAGANWLLRRFWEESSRTAVAAAGIAARLEGVDPDLAHTYVLFRDCGIPVMMRKFPGYAEVVEANWLKPGDKFAVVENNRFGFSHARVGFALARNWLLPDSLCKSILYHHQPQEAKAFNRDLDPADPRLVAFGILAEQIVAIGAGGGLCPDWRENEAFVLETLRISPDEIVALAQEIAPEPLAA